MQAYAQTQSNARQQIGFVPTMGALHKGHASLVEQARLMCEVVVVSVFVNPTQFNQESDLEKYPRTFDSDKEILEQLQVDVMFYPSVEEVYPTDEKPSYDLGGLDVTMEGPKRPGHFIGVVQVVSRFLDLVQPNRAFFGEKDFQQLAIIKHMSAKLGYDVEVVGCPTVREEDGLAMSSRNVRLSPNARSIAPKIYEVLSTLREAVAELNIEIAQTKALKAISEISEFDLEYLELVDSKTLQVASEESVDVQACIAVWLEGVRLIDNVKVK